MLREIGSNFWFSPESCASNNHLSSPSIFGCNGSDYVWMSTGRSATRLVLQAIEERNPKLNKIALIPAFTCHTVIEPFLDFGYEVIAIPNDVNLKTRSEDIIDLQRQTGASVVLFHHYFGFCTINSTQSLVRTLNESNVVVIEDRTQCLYSKCELSNADYYVCSIRKWCGVPDGGFAVCRDGKFSYKPTRTDDVMINIKRKASLLKYKYIIDGEGEKRPFKELFSRAETLLDNQDSYYAIGSLSAIIQSNLDVDFLIAQRRQNFNVLQIGLSDSTFIKPIFGVLPEEIVPLYFPVLVEDRERIQSILANNDVYAPVVWPKAACCPAVESEVEYIYQHILCIPIDQRYSVDDMVRVISIIRHEC